MWTILARICEFAEEHQINWETELQAGICAVIGLAIVAIAVSAIQCKPSK